VQQAFEAAVQGDAIKTLITLE